jgi:hypothetical protein
MAEFNTDQNTEINIRPHSGQEIDLTSTSLPSRNWLLHNIGIPLIVTLGACTTPKISGATELAEISPKNYPELKLLNKNNSRLVLTIFNPGRSITKDNFDEYLGYANSATKLLESINKNREFFISPSNLHFCFESIAQEFAEDKNISDVHLITIDNISEDEKPLIVGQVTKTIDLSIIPDETTLSKSYQGRIYVADGAYAQGERGCLSQWVNTMIESLSSRLSGFQADVKALRYAEKSAIRTSAKNFARFIEEDLQNNPLKPNEEITLIGHSQGAFIFSYLAHSTEAGDEFTKNIPWERVNRVIGIDLPMEVVHNYSAGYEFLVDPVLFIARNDILVFPLLCEIFFPVGNDYLNNTGAYKLVEKTSSKEHRLQRKMSDGSYVNPTVPGALVDNPNCQFEHHPFLMSNGSNNRIIREHLLELYLETLPLQLPMIRE